MEPEPEKFFIGMMEFFSILLPGALLTYLLKGYFYPTSGKLDGVEQWMVFLFSSYLLGHFIFFVGSWLDDQLYDRLRNATYRQQVRQRSEGKKLPWRLTRYFAERFFKPDDDMVVSHAARIRDTYLDPHGTSSTINAFQWCKARLALEHREALAMVQRFEADSKFFRSLVVVLWIVIVWVGIIWIVRALGIGAPLN